MTRALTPVLVVEDDPSTRSLLCEMLVVLGYPNASAGNAEEALEMLERETEGFSMLLADINLPGMSGIDLAESALRTQPGLQVVFVSGNAFLVADKTNFEFRLLPKPFDLNQLQHVLADISQYAVPNEVARHVPAGIRMP